MTLLAHDPALPAPTHLGDPSSFRYFAFLSYSSRDEAHARWLLNALERYRVPRRLVGRATPRGRVPRRLYPIFRDREELATSPDLSAALCEALKSSSHLIVLCSPAAAQSRFVDQEIAFFREHRERGSISCVILDGDPASLPGSRDDCYPAALRHGTDRLQPAEPLAADLRDKRARHDALLKLVAGLTGLPLDELRRRDRSRRMRNAAASICASIAILALLLTLGRALWLSRIQSQHAEYGRQIQRAAAELKRKNVGVVRSILEDTSQELRGWEWSWLSESADTSTVVLSLHASGVASLALSPDGRDGASVDAQGRALLWNAASGELEREIDLGFEPLFAPRIVELAFHPDGRRLLLVANRSTSSLVSDFVFFDYELETGRARTVDAPTHEKGLLGIGFSADGRYVTSAGFEGVVQTWEFETGRRVEQAVGKQALASLARWIGAQPGWARGAPTSWLRDGEQQSADVWWGFDAPLAYARLGSDVYLMGHRSGQLRFFDATGRELVAMRAHDQGVSSIHVDASQQLIATTSRNELKVWRRGPDALGAPMLEPVENFTGHSAAITNVVLDAKNGLIASADADGSTRVWPIAARAAERSIDIAQLGSVVAADQASGLVAITHSEPDPLADVLNFSRKSERPPEDPDRPVHIVSIDTGEEVASLTLPSPLHRTRGVAFSADGSAVAVLACKVPSQGYFREHACQSGPTVLLYSLPSGAPRVLQAARGTDAVALSLGPEGDRLLLAGADWRVHMIDVAQDRLLWSTRVSPEPARGNAAVADDYSVAFLPGGSRVYVRESRPLQPASRLVLLAADDAEVEASFDIPVPTSGVHSRPLAIAFDRSGRELVYPRQDGTLLLRAASGGAARELKGHARPPAAAAFDSDNRRLVTLEQDGDIRIWDPVSGSELCSLDDHGPEIGSPSFVWLRDHRLIRLRNGSIKIWETGIAG